MKDRVQLFPDINIKIPDHINIFTDEPIESIINRLKITNKDSHQNN